MNAAQTTRFAGPDMDEQSGLRSTGRTRVVTFRVSEGESATLACAWRSSSARSLSAFARDAALEKVQSMQGPSGSLGGDLSMLTRGLAQLDRSLQELSQMIRRVLGPGNFDSDETPGAGR